MSGSVYLVGSNLSEGGGVNRVIRDLSTIFSEHFGLDTTVLARNDLAPTYPFSAKVRIEVHPEAVQSRGFLRLMREVARRDYDNVIGFWHWDNIRIALAFAGSGKRPILTEHTSWNHPPIKTRAVRALAYRVAKAVCVLNTAELAYYRGFLSNAVLLPNPVPSLPAPDFIPRERLIIAVGHLIGRKNFADAVHAFAASGLATEGWRLVIVGSGPEKSSLDALIERLRLTMNVQIQPPTQDIARWYACASIMLITSTIEVFSLVLAEAMRGGVVPLAYAVDGPAFILQDHPDLLIAPGDVVRLGTRLRELAHSDALPERAELMKAVIEERFSEQVVARQWSRLLGC